MNKLLASELGFLGINVDSNFDLAWLKTEVADKIREGDQTSIYKLINFARHSESQEIRDYANIIAKLYEDKVEAYGNIDVAKKESEPEKEYEKKAETAEEVENAISEAIEAGEDIELEITSSIDLTSGTLTSINIPDGTNADIKLDKDVTITCTKEGFKVGKGSTLTLSGEGTIVATTKNANGAITADSAEVILDGVTIDGVTGKEDATDNWVYGVYAKNGSTVEFKSGSIHVGGASCISTNNTTGGSTINVSGGELLADYGYAIYMPAQGEVNITGGKVQGVHARMGTVNISGNAEILPVGFNADNCADLGSNINTSGSVELGDTIVVIAGTYNDPNGVDTEVNVAGNAKVTSNFRAAIGVYAFDTKEKSNVSINVENASNVTTTDEAFDAIKVYDHAYIDAAATASGKIYTPKVDSDITVTVAGEQVYPVA